MSTLPNLPPQNPYQIRADLAEFAEQIKNEMLEGLTPEDRAKWKNDQAEKQKAKDAK